MGMKRGTPEAAESIRNHGGHKTRKDEFQAFMERSILNPQFADEKYWIITGDMNCSTPLDDRDYNFGYENPRYWGQKYMLENVKQVTDLVKVYNCPDKRDIMVWSTQGGGRIDLMYGSEPMLKSMIKAKSPQVGFTTGKRTGISNFWSQSSDHLPVIVDFVWR
jgi:exonuclease III